MSLHLASAFAALAVFVCLGAAPPAAAGKRCTKPGYSYGALIVVRPTHGVAATIMALSTPTVETGHVAGWVGVAGSGVTPPADWLQVGLNAVPGTSNRLYYEHASAGHAVRYVELDADIPVGMPVHVAVRESRRDHAWRVWVGGTVASDAIALPAHGSLATIAASESWDGGLEGCNRSAYRFEGLVVADGSRWRRFAPAEPLADQGYRVVRGESTLTVSLGEAVDTSRGRDLQLSQQAQGRAP